MWRITNLVVGLWWVGCCWLVPPVMAQAPTSTETESSAQADTAEADIEGIEAAVQDLLKQLEKGSGEARTAAERRLVELGPHALGVLPQVTVDTPEEFRARLNRVRKQLQRMAAEAAVKGSRVTVSGSMKLSAALADLEKQTSNKLMDFRDQFSQPQLDPEVILEFEDEAYWTVLESIFEQAGLQLYAFTNQPNTLGFIARADGLTTAAQAAATELFRMEVIRVQAIRDVRDQDNQGLVVTVEVTWEPRLTPITIRQSLADLEVLGDDGKPMNTIAGRGITQLSVQEGISSVELELPFELPERSVQKIASLRGTLNAMVPGGEMTLEFDNLADAREVVQGQGGISVVLLRARRRSGLYEFRILLRIDASDEMKRQRGWVYSNEAYLLDPDGKKVEYAGLESFRDTLGEVGLSYKFDAPEGLKGYRFVYKSPSSVMNVPVEYEIKDIELP